MNTSLKASIKSWLAAGLGSMASAQAAYPDKPIKIVVQLTKATKVRPLAVTSNKRSGALPDVPTVAELGYLGFEANTWFAMMAPAGTPRDVLNRLNAEVNKILHNKALNEGFAAQSLETVRMDRPTLDNDLGTEAQKWGPVVQQTGAKVV